MRLQMLARTGHPDFLDLPWAEPLADWESERLVAVPRGVHRHVVRFVRYDETVYVIKELSARLAQREYRLLRHLAEERIPAVEVVGVVTGREGTAGRPLEAALITQLLEYALPYRLLFARESARALREPMLDALVHLLVRLHLVGFMWGDCSLSNTLFRRDASALTAYVVDVETGESHPSGLTDGQRRLDVETAIERCAGELYDLQAAGLLAAVADGGADPVELGEELGERYHGLWRELTREEVVGVDERYRIHERLRRINELGYDVEELELEETTSGEGARLRFRLRVIEPGRHQRRLYDLTGLEVQEHQARRLLNDIDDFGAWLQREEDRELSRAYIAHRWLQQSFEPVLSLIPEDLRGRREPAQLFHEVLEHWYRASTGEGRDLDLFDAARAYVDEVLRGVPEERLPTGIDLDAGAGGEGGVPG